jgi:hypothetical protein
LCNQVLRETVVKFVEPHRRSLAESRLQAAVRSNCSQVS